MFVCSKSQVAALASFQELKAWQEARHLAKMVFEISQQGMFAKDFQLRDQINAAAGSVMDNIAEGFERSGNKEFRQFLSVSKGSLGELQSQAARALDRNYITKETYEEVSQQILLTTKLVAGLMRYLKQSDLKGSKF